MSREKLGMRDVLEQLNEMFPDQGALNQQEVARFLGVNRTTVWRRGIRFSPVTRRVTKMDLARQICI